MPVTLELIIKNMKGEVKKITLNSMQELSEYIYTEFTQTRSRIVNRMERCLYTFLYSNHQLLRDGKHPTQKKSFYVTSRIDKSDTRLIWDQERKVEKILRTNVFLRTVLLKLKEKGIRLRFEKHSMFSDSRRHRFTMYFEARESNAS